MAGKTAEAQDPVLSAVVQRIDSNLVGYTLFHASATLFVYVMCMVTSACLYRVASHELNFGLFFFCPVYLLVA